MDGTLQKRLTYRIGCGRKLGDGASDGAQQCISFP